MCQRFLPLIRNPLEDLTLVTSLWFFTKRGIDLIDPLPTGKERVKYVIIAVDYFTKRAEDEPLAKIT